MSRPASPPLRFSDVLRRAELRRLPLYQEYFLPFGAAHQMTFVFNTQPLLGVALNRERPDFDDADRDLADPTRLHLRAAFDAPRASSIAPRRGSRSPGSAPTHPSSCSVSAASPPTRPASAGSASPRARIEVLALVARGRTDLEIADQLYLSHRTIEKHLQNAFDKLGVRERRPAAALLMG